MAFSYTVDGSSVIGAQRSTWGTWTSTGVTANAYPGMETGLKYVNSLIVTDESDKQSIEVHLNYCDGGVTPKNGCVYIIFTAGNGGSWNAIGYGGG